MASNGALRLTWPSPNITDRVRRSRTSGYLPCYQNREPGKIPCQATDSCNYFWFRTRTQLGCYQVFDSSLLQRPNFHRRKQIDLTRRTRFVYMMPVFRRLQTGFLICLLVTAIGGHWAFLQSAAWVFSHAW